MVTLWSLIVVTAKAGIHGFFINATPTTGNGQIIQHKTTKAL
jgi:hypothetical protein